ncbi:MAG: SUKH-3 domain-containing protein [Gemmataceae bacterium]
MIDFSGYREVSKLLSSAGWDPERKADLAQLIAGLQDWGFSIFPLAQIILEQFGGLSIPPLQSDASLYHAETVDFSPAAAVDGEQDRLQDWGRGLRQPVYPLGVYGSSSILFLVPDGGLFVGRDREIWPVAEQFERGIQALVFADRQPTWWEPTEYRRQCELHALPLGSDLATRHRE